MTTSDLAEHTTTLVSLIGILVLIVQSLTAIIFYGIKGDIKDLKDSMNVFIKEVVARLNKLERSLDSLWAEHRLMMNQSCHDCGEFHHIRRGDVHEESGERDSRGHVVCP